MMRRLGFWGTYGCWIFVEKHLDDIMSNPEQMQQCYVVSMEVCYTVFEDVYFQFLMCQPNCCFAMVVLAGQQRQVTFTSFLSHTVALTFLLPLTSHSNSSLSTTSQLPLHKAHKFSRKPNTIRKLSEYSRMGSTLPCELFTACQTEYWIPNFIPVSPSSCIAIDWKQPC